ELNYTKNISYQQKGDNVYEYTSHS
ncbi:hypothetical protein A5847_000264, partial [Enterococcus faecium]